MALSLTKSSNPALQSKAFQKAAATTSYSSASDVMTVSGTVYKTGLLLLLAVLAAGVSWGSSYAVPLMFGGIFGGLIVALAVAFKPTWAVVGAPLYALLEGLALGAISSFYGGPLAIQAVGLTFGTMACLLVAYTSGLITVSAKFRMGVIAATGGIFVFYMFSFLLGMFGFSNPALSSGPLGILFSLFVVTIAALNLVLDFNFIDESSKAGAPKHMEWYGAFGLMVTLVWLYLEILRLLFLLTGRE